MTNEFKYKTERLATGIYCGKLWGEIDAEKVNQAIEARIEYVRQFKEDAYVMIYDMREVDAVHRPSVQAGRSVLRAEPKPLAMFIVGGPNIIRVFATILNKALGGKDQFRFFDNLEDAVRRAEEIMKQHAEDSFS